MPVINDDALSGKLSSVQTKIHDSIASILKGVNWTPNLKCRAYEKIPEDDGTFQKKNPSHISAEVLVGQMLSSNENKAIKQCDITLRAVDSEDGNYSQDYTDLELELDSSKQLSAAKSFLRVLHSHAHGKNGLLAHSAYAALGGAVIAGVLTAAYAGTASKVAALAAYTLPKLMQLIHQQPTVAALAVSVAVVIGLVSLICAAVTATAKASSAAIARHHLDHFLPPDDAKPPEESTWNGNLGPTSAN